MRFLLPSMVAATMLIAIGATGSKAEAAMSGRCRNSACSNENLYARRKGLLPTILSPWLLRLWPRLWISALLRLRLRLSAIWLLWLWLETGHNHWHRTWLGLALGHQPSGHLIPYRGWQQLRSPSPRLPVWRAAKSPGEITHRGLSLAARSGRADRITTIIAW